MQIALLLFAVGLGLLLYSTHRLVGLSKRISNILKISPLIVGVTIVALGTSLPELVVSLVSVWKQDSGLAMGNIIGSNVVNVLMVFPIGLFIGKLRIGTKKTQRNALFLVGSAILFGITQLAGIYRFFSGAILLVLAIIVSILEYKLAVFGRTHEDVKRFVTQKQESAGYSMVLLVVLLLAGIILGGILIVESVEKISIISGISTTVLGLTVTAVATSLPELFTTIFSQEDNQEKITVGNILGSNIYNLLLVGGVITLTSPMSKLRPIEWFWFVISSLLFVIILKYYKGKKPPKTVGALLLLLFFLYILSQI